ncbi:MAG: zinc carboxypeptidase [Saprospiraceae bacterium]|nr:zinc carboxypeptidase [Saprospiraceae bacterium]
MTLRNTKVIIVVIFLFIQGYLCAQTELNYYLPEISYNSNIPTPESVLPTPIGEQHLTHDQLIYYLEKICAASENCNLTEYARSHENRPLVYLTISSKANLSRIEELKQRHNQLLDNSVADKLDLDSIPLVLYQGYTIHGDESSGSHAAVLIAYYLLSGQSDKIDKLLDQTIILLDPCYNPDGLQRFSTWVNMHRSSAVVTDPGSREFNQVWPRGRTNHYWFDLNRDWIFNIHPESKGRIETFHEWKPDVLTDHHEMGPNNTFFFQPGIPSRTNPNTPAINQELTEHIGQYHAQFLDSIGSMYYSKESFDDYYYGKGSTYPDINGCVGILFEQASSRGYLRETSNGLLSFPFTIRNQVVTSLSTQEAALDLKNEILEYKREFYARNSIPKKGYYIFESTDQYKANFFIEILNRHDINVYQANDKYAKKHKGYDYSYSYIVPKSQVQSGLVKTIFERVDEFPDSLFYDVSAWTLPLAFNVKSEEGRAKIDTSQLKRIEKIELPHNKMILKSVHALAIDWNNYLAPALLYSLLDNNILCKVLKSDAEYLSEGMYKRFKAGTIIIPVQGQKDKQAEETINFLVEEAAKLNLALIPVDSGQSREGKSIGSPDNTSLRKFEIAMIIGEGVNRYEAGSAWYQMDKRFNIPLSMIDLRQFNRINLDRYKVILMPDGQYNSKMLSSEKLKRWINKGGVLVAFRGALNFLNSQKIIKFNKKTAERPLAQAELYSDINRYNGAQVIGGAIFNTRINNEHPLFFGYQNDELAVFKRGTLFLEKVKNKLATPMYYTDDPVLSGYVSKENINAAKESASMICYGAGQGRIIAFADNPNFRGYWLGGSRLFANAIFFGDLIKKEALQY